MGSSYLSAFQVGHLCVKASVHLLVRSSILDMFLKGPTELMAKVKVVHVFDMD